MYAVASRMAWPDVPQAELWNHALYSINHSGNTTSADTRHHDASTAVGEQALLKIKDACASLLPELACGYVEYAGLRLPRLSRSVPGQRRAFSSPRLRGARTHECRGATALARSLACAHLQNPDMCASAVSCWNAPGCTMALRR